MTPDIKLRGVKIDDAQTAIRLVKQFMADYSHRQGLRDGVCYGISGNEDLSFYIFRAKKTVICVGSYTEGK